MKVKVVLRADRRCRPLRYSGRVELYSNDGQALADLALSEKLPLREAKQLLVGLVADAHSFEEEFEKTVECEPLTFEQTYED